MSAAAPLVEGNARRGGHYPFGQFVRHADCGKKLLMLALPIPNHVPKVALATSSRAHRSGSLGHLITYTVTPALRRRGPPLLRVSLRFRAETTGLTELAWPSRSQGISHVDRWVTGARVDGGELKPLGHGRWLVRSRPNAQVSILYAVKSGYARPPTVDNINQVAPAIFPSWFLATGEAIFAVPTSGGGWIAKFRWGRSNHEYVARSDLTFAGAGYQRMSDLQRGVLFGELAKPHRGEPEKDERVCVIVRGAFPFSSAEGQAGIRRILQAERAFWGIADNKRFTVIISALDPVSYHSSVGGEGRTAGFVAWADARSRLDALQLLVAHEYFHTWNADRLGGTPTGTAYWFTEGFTDYYSAALLVRSGLLSPAQFVTEWNRRLLNYELNPLRSRSEDEVERRFFESDDNQKLPYLRGALLAAHWNRALRRRSGGRLGLDDVLLTMQRRAASWSQGVAALFRETAAGLELPVDEDLREYLDQGRVIRLEKDAFGSCADVYVSSAPAFDLGFHVETGASGKVSSVTPESPAASAGLRPGDTLVSVDGGEPFNTDRPYTLTVRRDGGLRKVSFLPRGRLHEVPQLHLVNDPPSSCAASLSGL